MAARIRRGDPRRISPHRRVARLTAAALERTPGHDPADFSSGRDHGVPEPMCIGPGGRVTAAGLEGLTQKEAEKKIVEWVEERGQLEQRENYRHSVAFCERCHSRIEP